MFDMQDLGRKLCGVFPLAGLYFYLNNVIVQYTRNMRFSLSLYVNIPGFFPLIC
jgi:hypothetical protein